MVQSNRNREVKNSVQRMRWVRRGGREQQVFGWGEELAKPRDESTRRHFLFLTVPVTRNFMKVSPR
eukprot:765117-Hanusia_phi.AAC.2